MATKLRAVDPDERKAEAPKSLAEAVDSDEMTLLVALRAKLASSIDKGDVPTHAMRGYIIEIRDLDRSIRALEVRTDGDDITDATRVPDEAYDPAAY
jgi:hypothetical protein